jgi:hypothetical protein
MVLSDHISLRSPPPIRPARTLRPGIFSCAVIFFYGVCAWAAQTKTPESPAPWLLKVEHAPQQPRSGDTVNVTIQTRQEVGSVTLQYQLVEPGAYIELKDPSFSKGWISLAMTANPSNDERKTFKVVLPGELQKHRRLVRYRFRAVDSAGHNLQGPDPQAAPPNYAYFVYNGVPAWKGAINPKGGDGDSTSVITFSAEAMNRIRAYHLIAKKSSVENATWRERYPGKEYPYIGTLVAEGKVFDHIGFRARGGVWRYSMGKNMWKFDLRGEHQLRTRDDFGSVYPVPWSKLNLRACIQQGDYGHRGEQGMFESVGFALFNLAGVPAPETYWLQLRIIDEAEEAPSNQYRGDFWGLYLAIENEDGRFLKTHDLPSGNLYKMENGFGELKHHSSGAVTNSSDLRQFMTAYSRSERSETWWRTNFDLAGYYSHRAICECIHHYDIGMGKNYDYFHNPQTGKWQILPWDIDLTWANNMFGNGEDPFKRLLLYREPFQLEYQNRLREIRDLLFNPEQAGKLIDEFAQVIWDPNGSPSIVEADRRKWDYHPIMATGDGKAGQGLFYQASKTGDFRGMVQLMKNYVKARGNWIDKTLLNDPDIPGTPTIRSTGSPGFAPATLRFQASGYRGANSFAALKWRIAEITTTNPSPSMVRTRQLYEINPRWESGELKQLDEEVEIPPGIAKSGHSYRVRGRVKDSTGRWSHWSAPVEFVAGQ